MGARKLRKSTLFCLYIAANVVVMAALAVHTVRSVRRASPGIAAMADLVKRVELTDLCLFTEARYTRNPALADPASAFQDSPMALEHFPSGAIVAVPPHLKQLR